MTARGRLAAGLVGVGVTAAVVRRDRVGRREVRLFRAVNGLPDDLHGPLWVAMQAGAAGSSLALAAGARLAGRPGLAGHLLVSGSASWLLAKGVKVLVQRPRPVALLPDTRCRGTAASGRGYVSGHAAVAAALTVAVLPELTGAARVMALGVGPVVGLARVYVGAHLPLDVVGGAALGLATEACVTLLVEGLSAARPRRG